MASMGLSMGLGSLGAQASALQSKQDQVVQQVKSPEALNDAKIDKGSREFEAILVGSWLQQAEQSFASVPGADDDDDKDVSRDQVMSFGVQSLSTSLAASGGIGIGKMVAKAMHAAADKANAQITENAASTK